MSKGNRFVSLVASTLTASMVIMLAGLVTGSLTAKVLGVAGRGELAAIQLVGSFLGGLCTAGLPAAVIYFTGINSKGADSYYTTGLLLAMVLGVPCLVGGYLVIPHFLANNRPEVLEAARLYLLFIPLSILSTFVLATFQGQMKIHAWNVLRTIAYVLWLGPVLWMYFKGHVSSVEFSSAYLVFLAAYVVLYLLVQYRSRTGSARFDQALVKPLVSYGWATTFANLSQQSSLKLDQMFIAAVLLPDHLGIYVVAVAWSAAHAPLIGAVSYVIVPYVSRIASVVDQAEALGKITRIMVVLNLVLSAALVLITPLAIHILFGPQFAKSVAVAYVLIVASMFANIKGVLAEGLRGVGKPEQVMRGEIFGVLVTALLLAISLSDTGLITVAAVSALGYAITFFYLATQLKQHMGVSLTALLVPTRQDLGYVIHNAWELVRRAFMFKSDRGGGADA